ncbi:MAG: NAD-dependent epimerase/dehydratase family protein [Halobacteriovoraceae bacterium]|nr:NAD-dependent epimerase/dehydratase family protein [Halobacteriovoraceae bacterium]MBT5094219.1 NAD-dependent epimerase/dehydratase family protein [Halobacteriovoraceae bacterium]
MKVLVTGAAGFIASHLCEALLTTGHEVVGIDNFDPFYPIESKKENLELLHQHKGFSFTEGDLSDAPFVEKFLTYHPVDLVIHLAAKAGVRPSLEDPIGYVNANITATVSLLEGMRKNGIKKFIFASSSSIYGESKTVPFKEDTSFDHSISLYATTKQSGELFTRMYHNLYKLDVINLRFFTVYGPRQRPDLAIHKFLKSNLLDETITIFGDGSMARDYTYVSDTVQGIIGAMNRIVENPNVYETYNLGNSHPVSLKELILAIEKTTGKPLIIQRTDVPLGDVPITYADISSSKEKLGYHPQVSLESGLAEFYKWIQKKYS